MFPKLLNLYAAKKQPADKKQSLMNHQRHDSPGVLSCKSRALDMQKTKMEALTRQSETLWASDKARTMSLKERLKLQPPIYSAQSPIRGPSLSKLNNRFRAIPTMMLFNDDLPSWFLGDHQKNPVMQNEEEYEEEKEVDLSVDPSFSLVDSHTPDELRAIQLITTPVEQTPTQTHFSPLVAPTPKRRVLHLPVMKKNLSGEKKKVNDGHQLQAAQGQAWMIQKRPWHLNPDSLIHVPRPPTAAKKNGAFRSFNPVPPPRLFPLRKTETSVAFVNPIPPPTPTPLWKMEKTLIPVDAIPPPKPAPLNKTESAVVCAYLTPPPEPALPKRARAHKLSGVRKAALSCKPVSAGNKKLEELMPLLKPVERLALFSSLLSSDDWEKKIQGLCGFQALAQHHKEILRAELQDVSFAVKEEVKNLRSCVASAAINTLMYLYTYLKKENDSMVDKTGSALLQKIAQSSVNVFLQKQAAEALDALVQYCSPGPVLNLLLRIGLCHLSDALRASAAQKIHLLANGLGAAKIMSTGKAGFNKTFLIAVNQMSVDASAEVRRHGLTLLEEVALQPNFMELWRKVVPSKDRPLLEKHLQKINIA